MEMIIHMDSFTPLSTNEILEIDENLTYSVRGLELKGNELIHKVANGCKYEELDEQLKAGVNNE